MNIDKIIEKLNGEINNKLKEKDIAANKKILLYLLEFLLKGMRFLTAFAIKYLLVNKYGLGLLNIII